MALIEPTENQLREALGDIVEGVVVKRCVHRLDWGGRDISPIFVKVLASRGYAPTTVDAVRVKAGERVPAFYLENGTAYFGWVFWEKFTDLRSRKLFGSYLRNAKGDWAIQIPPTRPTTIYVNASLKTEMDVDNLTVL